MAARLFLSIGLPSVLLVVALGLLAWWGARAAVLESLERELTSTVAMGAATVNSLSLSVIGPGSEETRSYRNLVRRLKGIKDATGSARVLVLGDDELVRVDAEGRLPIFGLAPRAAIDRAELKQALADHPAVGVPFQTAGGRRLLAAYAKIPERKIDLDLGDLGDLDQNAQHFVLALEAPADALDAVDEVASYLLAVVLLFVVLVLVLASVVARTITGPILTLAEAATDLGAGGLHRPLPLSPRQDEVGLLGRTLEKMRQALLTRDEERQMMLAGIAHEVRNPLGGMELFGGLLEEEIEDLDQNQPIGAAEKAELLSHAARVRKELRYLTGVVNDFLAYARETGLSRDLVDVPALLEDVRSLKEEVGGAAIIVETDIVETDLSSPHLSSPQLPLNRGRGKEYLFPLDRGRIKESLLNLVGNALQATEPSGVVTLRARRGEPTAGEEQAPLVIEVVDTGKGMEPATLARIFQPFFTTKEKGSGLGLPLVRKFARDHGGEAEAFSTLGAGTTVRLTLAYSDPLRAALNAEGEPGLLGVESDHDQALAAAGAGAGPAAPDDDDDDDEPALLGDG